MLLHRTGDRNQNGGVGGTCESLGSGLKEKWRSCHAIKAGSRCGFSCAGCLQRPQMFLALGGGVDLLDALSYTYVDE